MRHLASRHQKRVADAGGADELRATLRARRNPYAAPKNKKKADRCEGAVVFPCGSDDDDDEGEVAAAQKLLGSLIRYIPHQTDQNTMMAEVTKMDGDRKIVGVRIRPLDCKGTEKREGEAFCSPCRAAANAKRLHVRAIKMATKLDALSYLLLVLDGAPSSEIEAFTDKAAQLDYVKAGHGESLMQLLTLHRGYRT